jgi:iron complex transport system substrate-binding protein
VTCRFAHLGRAGSRAGALAAAVLLAGVAGCSPFGRTTEAGPAPSPTPAPTVHYAADGTTFPATVTHRYGDTVVEAEPQRVVTLGRHDVDTVLSFGVRPIGVRDPFGADQPYEDWPWAPANVAADELQTVSETDSIDFDAVAALHPDLITAVYSDLSEPDYQHLTEIAPTIAQPPDVADLQSSWQEETRMIGTALGRARQVEQVIDDTEEVFRDARRAHPEFGDADVAMVTYAADGTLRLVNPYEPRARFLAALGMRFPERVSDRVGDEPFDAEIELADLGELGDLDALVWLADPAGDLIELARERADLEDDPAYKDLAVVRKGGSVFLDVSAAVSFGSSISLAYAANENRHPLAQALRAKAKADKEAVDRGLLPGEETDSAPRATRTPKATPKPTTKSTTKPTTKPTTGPRATGTPAPAPSPAATLPPPPPPPAVTPSPTATVVSTPPAAHPRRPGR